MPRRWLTYHRSFAQLEASRRVRQGFVLAYSSCVLQNVGLNGAARLQPSVHVRHKALFLLGFCALILCSLNCGTGPKLCSLNCGTGPKDVRLIQHTVFIMKENRTFDHYFGQFPGANGATSGATSTGQTIPLAHLTNPADLANLCNGWSCALLAMDGGKMNGFDLIDGSTLEAYTQLEQHDIPNYWASRNTSLWRTPISPQLMPPAYPMNFMPSLLSRAESSMTALTMAREWPAMARPRN